MKDKNKIVTIILAVVCVISIIGVVYLYTANSSLKSENANLQSELENAQSQLEELQEKITELEATVETLEEAKASLEAEQAAAAATSNTADNTEVTTESTDTDEGTATGDESAADESGVTVNSTHDDVQLGDDEYKGDNEIDGAYDRLSDEEKAEVDQILEELLEEHPEWLEDNGGDIPYTGPAQGTPSTGVPENPDWQFGQGDYSEGVGLTAY